MRISFFIFFAWVTPALGQPSKVFLKARLYEVDKAFYKEVLKVKPIPLEELEKQFLEGKPLPGEHLWKLLGKQKVILDGEEIQADPRKKVAIFSRLKKNFNGEKERQAIRVGVTFLAGIRVSPDRRYVCLKLERKDIKEVKVMEIPDGGSIIIPIHFRQDSKAEERRWVLTITSRIVIEEEERQIWEGYRKFAGVN